MSETYVETPSVRVSADLVSQIVRAGGYTHPLFQQRQDDASTDQQAPLPGQGVLLLAGGLVEQSGLLDGALALLEVSRASFTAMVRPGDEIRVRVTPGSHRESRRGHAVQDFDWMVVSGDDQPVASAAVKMLVESPVEVPRS